MTKSDATGPGVRFPPPILFVAGIVAGWLLQRVVPVPVSTVLPSASRLGLAWAVIAAGLALVVWAMGTFVVARTAIYPNEPARVVVSSGPYRFSRNPMYVAMTSISLGVGLWLDSLWVIALIPLVLAALTTLVIRREEAYLSSAFGEQYAAYRARVRRWV